MAIENSRVHTLLADSEQLFRATFDRSPIAIALLTPDSLPASSPGPTTRKYGDGSTAPHLTARGKLAPA